MMPLFRDNFPPHYATERNKDSREKLNWFAWLPCDDFRNWLMRQRWTVNPYSTVKCREHLDKQTRSQAVVKGTAPQLLEGDWLLRQHDEGHNQEPR